MSHHQEGSTTGQLLDVVGYFEGKEVGGKIFHHNKILDTDTRPYPCPLLDASNPELSAVGSTNEERKASFLVSHERISTETLL
jgi:hypothetical protein